MMKKGFHPNPNTVFPFNEFLNINTPRENKTLPFEPTQTLADTGLRGIANENIQSGYMQFCEPQIMQKKQEVAKFSATSLQSGLSELAILE